MRTVLADMTVSEADIERDIVTVLDDSGRIVGFYRLRLESRRAELVDLFIDPAAMGRGLGRRLFGHAVEVAREHGASMLELDSDPHAEGFYVALGMTRMGETSSLLIADRRLPRLRYEISPGR